MREKIWVLVIIGCIATMPFTTAQAQKSAAPSLGPATAAVINTMPATTVPMAVSNVASSTAGSQSGQKKGSEAATTTSARPKVTCTYADFQANGSCPAGSRTTCTYADFQANGSCPAGH
jgi:hypothetical protein